MQLLQPSSNIQLSAKNPDKFLKRSLEIVRKGWGQPSIFNADTAVSYTHLYFAETIFVGTTAGYAVAMTFGNRIKPAVMIDILEKGKWNYVIPIILGLLMYTRFSKSLQWLSRYPISFTVGVGAGVVLTKQWKPMLIDQVVATIKPLSGPTGGQIINAVILLVGVVCTLSFFLFTAEPKGPLKYGSQIGRYTMMIAFGAA